VGRFDLEERMITSAEQLEVFIGDPPELHVMSLYELDGKKCATFTALDSSNEVWVPVPPPRIFTKDESAFDMFKEELAENGFEYRDPCSRLQ
jgi:hypothetical protein